MSKFVESSPFQTSEFKWTHSANWLLINSYLELKDEFRDPINQKRDLWCKIANKFSENGYEVQFETLEKKFRNLKATYYQVKERKQQSSNKQIKWEYFKVFDDLLQEEDIAAATSTTTVAIETISQDDPRLANFRSAVYVPTESRKRKRSPPPNRPKSSKETTKIVSIEPDFDGINSIMEEDEKSHMNGFKDDLTNVDEAVIDESQDSTFDDDDEFEDGASGNDEIPTFDKKNSMRNLQTRKALAETRYFNRKAAYFEKQTLLLDMKKKLMILEAHKLKLEIEKMKNIKNEPFTS